jgi:hypothetical protein
MASSAMRLHDAQGHRRYLTAGERDAFRTAAADSPRVTRTFCLNTVLHGMPHLGGAGAHRRPRRLPG